jgi:hypothetical protein
LAVFRCYEEVRPTTQTMCDLKASTCLANKPSRSRSWCGFGLSAQKLLRTMLFAEIPMVQESNAADVRQSVPFPPAMYDPTLHIDGLVVCSLLRNAKMTATLCHLTQVQCRRKWLRNCQQSFRDATLPPPSSRILCTVYVVIHQERGARKCAGLPTAQSRGELGC